MLIPFQSIKELSFTASFNFSYKDHVNVQTGDLYSSAIGKDINVVNLKFGGKFSYLLNKKYGLRLTGGVDRTDSESEADELNSVSNRYFLQIAGSY